MNRKNANVLQTICITFGCSSMSGGVPMYTYGTSNYQSVGYSSGATYSAPSVSYTQPQYTASSVQYAQPSVSYAEPSAQYAQTSVQYAQPATSVQYTQPAASAVQYSQPATSVQYAQPSAQYYDSSVQYSQQPAVQYAQPSVSYSAPSTSEYILIMLYRQMLKDTATDIIQPVVDQPVVPDCRILSGVVNRTDSGLTLAPFANRHRRLYNKYLGPLSNLKP
uniref:DNA-directed RNA polymerase II subunit RPB1-like n=1 Tax=Ascaris lumbricoides TaxID=6252 RepID=A0A0M3I4I7_ASCLU